jgi:hypothetical protein
MRVQLAITQPGFAEFAAVADHYQPIADQGVWDGIDACISPHANSYCL